MCELLWDPFSHKCYCFICLKVWFFFFCHMRNSFDKIKGGIFWEEFFFLFVYSTKLLFAEFPSEYFKICVARPGDLAQWPNDYLDAQGPGRITKWNICGILFLFIMRGWQRQVPLEDEFIAYISQDQGCCAWDHIGKTRGFLRRHRKPRTTALFPFS